MNSLISKRLFSAGNVHISSLYNYSCKTNPRVYFTLSRDGNNLGDLVFEVFQNHTPKTAENFIAFANGTTSVGSYKGKTFTGGYPGIVLTGGRVTPCN